MSRSLFAALLVLAISAPSAFSAPRITSVSPSSGPTAGGGSITITGTAFGQPTGQVQFDGAAATVHAWTDTRITCVLPPGNSGEAAVQVIAGGVTSEASTFFYGGPFIESVDPPAGPSYGGTLITLRGSNFGLATGSRVTTIGDVEAPEVQYLGHDGVVVQAPEGAVGPAQVITRLNGFWSNSATYTFEAASVIVPRAPRFALRQNVPNPVIDETSIPIDLSEACAYALGIYDVRGRRVRHLDGEAAVGSHAIRWDATDDAGRRVAPGLYFYRFAANGQVAARRLLLTR